MASENRNLRLSLGCSLPVLGGLIVLVVALYQVFQILTILGQTIQKEVVLSTPVKFCISLYLSLGLYVLILTILGSYMLSRGLPKTSAKAFLLSAFLSLIGQLIPSMYGFNLNTIPLIAAIVGVGFTVSGFVFAATIPSMSKRKAPLLGSGEVAMIVLFSILYAMLTVFSQQICPIPSPVGGYLHFEDLVVFFAAPLFGYKVGGLVGALGAVIGDFYLAYPRWYVSILAHGLEGFIPGLAKKKSFLLQVVACFVGGSVMAFVYFFVNVFLKGCPVAIVSFIQDLVGQASVSIILGLTAATITRKTLLQTR